jgi:hypothetical protein
MYTDYEHLFVSGCFVEDSRSSSGGLAYLVSMGGGGGIGSDKSECVALHRMIWLMRCTSGEYVSSPGMYKYFMDASLVV